MGLREKTVYSVTVRSRNKFGWSPASQVMMIMMIKMIMMTMMMMTGVHLPDPG